MSRDCYIYILTNRLRGTLYIGVTNNLLRRVWEHRLGKVPGFTRKYRLRRLVYFEHCTEFAIGIEREKRLKRWRRQWKLNLIEARNPDWKDLYPGLIQSERHDADVPY